MFTAHDAHQLVLTLVYSVVGMLVFSAFFFAVAKFTPFPILKEIEEDQNTALAILLGSALIGLSIIIAAAIV